MHKAMVNMSRETFHEDVSLTIALHSDLTASLPTSSNAVSSRFLPQQIGPVGAFHVGPKLISEVPATTSETVYNISPEPFSKLCHGGALTTEVAHHQSLDETDGVQTRAEVPGVTDEEHDTLDEADLQHIAVPEDMLLLLEEYECTGTLKRLGRRR